MPPSELRFDVVAGIVRELAPFSPHYDLFGGEPLLYRRIGEVVRLIKSVGSTLNIATNGTKLVEHAELLVDAEVDEVWISVDGPPAINDQQRGAGTFEKIQEGIRELHGRRARKRASLPQLGITFVVTPLNHQHLVETFLHAIDRRYVDAASIEMQSYLTASQLGAYATLLNDRFQTAGVVHAAGLVRDVADFAGIDPRAISDQIQQIREVYEAEGKRILTRPRLTTTENLAAYFGGRFDGMADFHSRCVFPWMYAEVAANGDVTPCHTFYDLTFGNVNTQPLLEIWRSDRFDDARQYFRSNLSPVCNACCLYHTEPSSKASQPVQIKLGALRADGGQPAGED